MHLVLPSQRWTDSLLFTNHVYRNEKYRFKTSQFFEHLHFDRKYKSSPLTDWIYILIIIEENHLHIREKISVQE